MVGLTGGQEDSDPGDGRRYWKEWRCREEFGHRRPLLESSQYGGHETGSENMDVHPTRVGPYGRCGRRTGWRTEGIPDRSGIGRRGRLWTSTYSSRTGMVSLEGVVGREEEWEVCPPESRRYGHGGRYPYRVGGGKANGRLPAPGGSVPPGPEPTRQPTTTPCRVRRLGTGGRGEHGSVGRVTRTGSRVPVKLRRVHRRTRRPTGCPGRSRRPRRTPSAAPRGRPTTTPTSTPTRGGPSSTTVSEAPVTDTRPTRPSTPTRAPLRPVTRARGRATTCPRGTRWRTPGPSGHPPTGRGRRPTTRRRP